MQPVNLWRWELHRRVLDWIALQHRTLGVTGSCLTQTPAMGSPCALLETMGPHIEFSPQPSLSWMVRSVPLQSVRLNSLTHKSL